MNSVCYNKNYWPMQSTSSTEVTKIRHFVIATKHLKKMAAAKLPQDKLHIKTKYIK
jgi:hypothetical protein